MYIFMGLIKNTLQWYFWYTKLVYLKSATLKQLMLYLMQFNCSEVQLKIYWSTFGFTKVELYCKYTSGTL